MKTSPLIPLAAIAGMAALTFSCSEEARMAKGFALPEGDIAAGKAAFAELKCTQCHSVDGVELEAIQSGTGYVLGGEVRKIRTYGELVTSVINPKHDVSPTYAATHPPEDGKKPTTPMPAYNSDMTVKQLTDIVAFLHSRFRETGPEFPDYPIIP